MKRFSREQGQASLEYAIVGVVLISIIGTLAALWRFFSTGRLSRLVEDSASHAMNNLGGVFDALLF